MISGARRETPCTRGIGAILAGAVVAVLAFGAPLARAQEEAPAVEPAADAGADTGSADTGTDAGPAAADMVPAAAETPEERRGAEPLPEIVVTARKVTESIQEAPLSVVVLDAEKLTSADINKVEELVPYVPNFSMSETGIGTNLYVRGIGSGINQGFEQSVGLYVDGIYYGRGQLIRMPFLDVGQVEALRGPQAILLGNNSIAGALNLTTARPTDTFEAYVNGLYQPNFYDKEMSAAISGPLNDRLSARLAGRYKTSDGYETNVTLGDREEPNRTESAVRLTLAWAGDTWTGTLKGEHNSFDITGRQIEIVKGYSSIEAYRDPTLAAQQNVGLTSLTGFSRNTGSSGLWVAGQTYLQYLDQFFDSTPGIQGNPLLGNDILDYNRGSNGDKSDNDVDVGVLTLNVELGDYTLTSISGYLQYSYDETCDCDFTGAGMFSLNSTENYKQWSQELRIASPTTDRIHWLAGLYYQHDKLKFGDQIFLPIGSGVVRLVGYATTGNDQGADNSLGNTSAFRDFDQHDTVSSVFGQVGMDFTERWRGSLGLRYTHMEKDASRVLREGDLYRNPFDIYDPEGFDRLGSGAVLFASIFKVSFHQLAGERTEDHTAYELVSEFDLTDDIMIYGSVKSGFKSGGFDARSNSEPVPGSTGVGTLFPAASLPAVQSNVDPGTFEFKPEDATAFEVGSKLTMLDGTAELNLALFLTKFDNLQVSIYDGTLGFNVGNAASATTEGVELDGRWSISSDWFLTGSLAYLDFNFDNFKNGQCNQGQAPTYPTNLPPSDPNYQYRGKCDYTGKTNQYVARWSGAAALNYEHPISPSLLFRAGLDTQFTSAYNPSQNLDPRIEQAGYAIWDLRLAIADIDRRWEIAVYGRNLSDQEIVAYANDTPLAFSQFGAPTFYGFVDQPRSVAVQASYRFGD